MSEADDLLSQLIADVDNPYHDAIIAESFYNKVRAYLDAPKDEPVAWNDITDEELKVLHEEEQFGLFCDADEFIDISRAVIAKFKYRNPPTKTAPKKPMTEEEMAFGFTEPRHSQWQAFVAGARWAERHHGIPREEA